jgi:TetR/AcrR family transcriptional regulator
MSTQSKPVEVRRGSRRQPDASRKAILKAALAEFSQQGLAGARVDAIAEAAGVNKALLYYYFHDKEGLYAATLDGFFAPLHQRIMAICDQPGSAGERFLTYVREHFDAIAESQHYARIFMGELMSAGRGGATQLDRVAMKYMRPTGMMVIGLLQEGIGNGEFRNVDPVQVVPSAIGTIVHYFLTAPLRERFLRDTGIATPTIEERRAAVLDFIAAAVFANREAGIGLAAKIAASESTRPASQKHALSRTKGKRK